MSQQIAVSIIRALKDQFNVRVDFDTGLNFILDSAVT